MTNASEYRNLPLASLTESANNPRRSFDEVALNELAESIKTQGILAPLVVRPVGQHFEIVAGARRYRAAHLAGLETAPVRIVELTDAQAVETSIVENLQRRDVHPLDEAQGFAALMRLEEPKYSIEQIGAKVGKSPVYVAARLRLVELSHAVAEAFAKDEIGVGHALLLAKLQPEQQEEALAACYQEQYGGPNKTKRILLPVRQLQQWIEHNILLELASAPFSKDDAQLVPEAGACLGCPKRTGHNTLLFAEIGAGQPDSCSDPKCYAAKVEAHIRQSIATKPKLVQISTAYGAQKDGGVVVPRNRYVEIRTEKPTNPKQRDWPEYKTCKFTTDAIVIEGSEKGELRRVCANPECPVHHPRKQPTTADAVIKAEQEQRRREEAIAQTTGLRVLSGIVDAVPVRLMKRDLLFVVEHLAAMLDEHRLAIVLRQNGIGKATTTANDSPAKLLAAFIRKADESTLGHLLVEIVILHSTHSPTDSGKVLKEAADLYKVDVNAITAKVKQEFAAKDKAKAVKKVTAKPSVKTVKGARAA
ncbi:MAG: ParB/RepB/Spo0J family partition protein [Terracidiphilus sp.]|nr:ParB/RepB/Spo0J family partition protein [Terracidiphilus sp.]MDR3776568.1 ParB/RepB/Spo0J family partition protein [Terracidiphilus sp.]